MINPHQEVRGALRASMRGEFDDFNAGRCRWARSRAGADAWPACYRVEKGRCRAGHRWRMAFGGGNPSAYPAARCCIKPKGLDGDRRARSRLLENAAAFLIACIGSPTYTSPPVPTSTSSWLHADGRARACAGAAGQARRGRDRRWRCVDGARLLSTIEAKSWIGLNGHYSASGMQPSATKAGVDRRKRRAPQAARGGGVRSVARRELRGLLHSGEGPLFIHARVDADDQPRVVPSRDGVAVKQRFMQAAGTA